MLIETIWDALYSGVTMTITVTALIYGFYLFGRLAFLLLRLPTIKSSSIIIAVGISITLFTSWYAYKLGIGLDTYITTIFFAAITLFAASLFKHRASREKVALIKLTNSVYIIPLFSFALSLQALIAFNTSTPPIGTLGNNDIYDWSMLATYLLGQPGYDNIFTTLGDSAQQYRIDSFGTFFIIALFAKFIGTSPLEASTIFTIFCQSLIGLSIFDIVKKSFYLKSGASFGIALIISAGSFFFYLAYNNFYGQLIATFFYLTIISALQHIAILNNDNQKIDFRSRLVLPLFPLIGILLVYQSGFFVFITFAIIFCLIHLIFNQIHYNKSTPIIIRTQTLLLPLLGGVFFSLILLPELALHTFQRTLDVKSSLNGWPLPLIAPEHILSIPSSKEFPQLIGNTVSYIITLGLATFVFLLSLISSKKESTELAYRLFIFITFSSSSIAAYILAYLIKGEIYQVWKFAAFVALPMSFVFFVSFVLLCQQSTYFGGFFRKLLIPLFILGCVFVVAINPSNRNLESISPKIEQMKVTKHKLLDSDIKNIILTNMTYGDTMMAFNILSEDFKVYPTIQTYIYPIDDSLIQQLNQKTTRVLVSTECITDNQYLTSSYEYDIILINEMLNNHAHPFGMSRSHCQNFKVALSAGFSNIEDWGVWTVGYKSSMTITLPPALIGMELRLAFNVQPFNNQDVSVEISGYSKNWAIKQPTKLSFILPPDITNQKQLLLNFTIDHPISPSSLDSKSSDTRLLGLGFVSLNISNTHQ